MNKETKYLNIKNDIVEKISLGIYKVGDKLPSEAELSRHYEVSRHTIRAALTVLEFDEVIVKEQGLGSFVKNPIKEDSIIVGVITTYISEYIFPTINRGIESVLSENGYSMLLASTNNDIETEKLALQMMLDNKIDGLIVEPTKSAKFNPNIELYLKIQKMGIPIIMINSKYEELDFPYISINDYESSYAALTHLVKNNHKNIGGIFKSDDRQGKERLRGFVRACQDHGIDYDSSNIVVFDTENQTEVVERETIRIIKEKKVTALVCYNDTVAMNVLNAAWLLNLKIPEDLSLISFDNSMLSTISEVKITSINHPKMLLGEDAAKELIKMINDKEYTSEDIIYPVVLDIKNSVKTL